MLWKPLMGRWQVMVTAAVTAAVTMMAARAVTGGDVQCVDKAARETVRELHRADIRRTTELIQAVRGLREDLRHALDDQGVCGGVDADAPDAGPR